MAAQPAIEVTGLEKSFGALQVLRGVDLLVPPGSVFALLGANGAGKSTLVRILSTLLRPDAGSARVGGHDTVSAARQVRQRISLTGQFTAVDDMLTGAENLSMVARLRHLPQPRRIANALLQRFALVEAGNRRVKEYSGGMRRRLDIAMSLIGDPELVFLDEPTTGLDPQARREVWQTVRNLAYGGTTILLTTQYLEEAEQLADRVAVLHEGRILTQGTVGEIKRQVPGTRVEYVQRQPSLEEVFLALVGEAKTDFPTEQ